jgi:hypothetical protein
MLHSIRDKMYIYKVELSFWNVLLKRGWLGLIKGPNMHSRDILRKAKGDHLDRVHSDQMVLKMIRRGRLVLFIRGLESQN